MIRASYSTDRRRDRLSTVGEIVSGLEEKKQNIFLSVETRCAGQNSNKQRSTIIR